MLHDVRFTHLLHATLLSSLMLAAIATPTLASGKTRWVDDDGKAGSNSCSGSKTAAKTVQKAIDAAGPNDTIKVCPGTYAGALRISGNRDGLTLRSASSVKAVLKAPLANGPETPILTIDHVDGVTVTGFAIRSTTAGVCRAWTGISAIRAKHVSIVANDIRPLGTITTVCGIGNGIIGRSATTGTISGNVIKDFRRDAIRVTGAGTSVIVKGNTLQFDHIGGVYASEGQGIAVTSGGIGKVHDNSITSPASAGNGSPSLGAAIHLDQPGAGTVISANTTHHSGNGLRGYAGSGVSIHDNSFIDGGVGILLQGLRGSTIRDNVSRANTQGVYAQSGATGNTITGNDFRYNVNDCWDDTDGSKSAGTANIWAADKGTSNVMPDAICD